MKSSEIEQKLYEWVSPQDALALSEMLADLLGEAALTRRGKTFREAWVSAKFASFRGATKVRLLREREEPTPDFALRFGEEEQWFETTEADRPSRRRGAEPPLLAPRYIADDEWTDPAEYATHVKAIVRNKVEKCYFRCDGLVIYQNAWPIAGFDCLDADWWTRVLAFGLTRFGTIWVFDGRSFTPHMVGRGAAERRASSI